MTCFNDMTLGFYVRTRYLGPTNYRGSRVKAVTASGRSIVLDWDHALNPADNHAAAFNALLAKCDRAPDGVVMVNGGLNDGYVFMCRTVDAA